MDDTPSPGILAGQLGYLFEERPELRSASTAALAAQLNHEDRYARARSRYPLATDAEIRDLVDEFPERITASDVEAALSQMRSTAPGSIVEHRKSEDTVDPSEQGLG